MTVDRGLSPKSSGPAVLSRLSESHILLISGLILSEPCWVQFMAIHSRSRNYSDFGEAALAILTALNVAACLRYVWSHKFSRFNYFYEFVAIPMFTVVFMDFEAEETPISAGLGTFLSLLIGCGCTLIFILNFNPSSSKEPKESIEKVGTKFRVFRVLKLLLFSALLFLQIVSDSQVLFSLLLVFNIAELYTCASNFVFQDPYKEYLVTVGSVTSVISSLDMLLWSAGYSGYAFAGELFLGAALVFEFRFLVRLLVESKYMHFLRRNVETTDESQFLAVACMLRELIRLEDTPSFEYSPQFTDEAHIIFYKMLVHSRAQALTATGKWPQEHFQFIQLIDKRFRNTHNFAAFQFYISCLVSKDACLKNRAISEYYRKVETKENTQNFFTHIDFKILYSNLLANFKLSPQQKRSYQILTLCESLRDLSQKVVSLCRLETEIMNKCSNSDFADSEVCGKKFLERNRKKLQIDLQIDELLRAPLSLESCDFLYITLLYKVIFCREHKLIREKIYKKILVPNSTRIRKLKEQLLSEFKRNSSILVCSSQRKGLIVNQNQNFNQRFGSTVQNGQQLKRFIGDLFPLAKQKKAHSELVEDFETRLPDQAVDHSANVCYILRKIPASRVMESLTGKAHEKDYSNIEEKLLPFIEPTKISMGVHVHAGNELNYLCVIEPQNPHENALHVLENDLENLKLHFDGEFEMIAGSKVQQLGSKLIVCKIAVSESLKSVNSDSSLVVPQISELNRNQVVRIETEKFEKIERQLDFEKYRPFAGYACSFAKILLSVLLCVAVGQGLSIYKEHMFEDYQPYIKLQNTVFLESHSAEKRVALSLAISYLIQKGQFDSGGCSALQIVDMGSYVQENLLQFLNSAFDATEHLFLSKDQSIGSLFDDKCYSFHGSPKISYKKYLNNLKSFAFDRMQTISFLRPQEQKLLFQEIEQAMNSSQADKDSFFFILREEFRQNMIELLQYDELYLFGFLICFVGTYLVVNWLILVIIRNRHQETFLLKTVSKKFIRSRIKQMGFVCNQLSKLQRNEVSDVSVNTELDLRLTQKGRESFHSLRQFEELSFTENYRLTNTALDITGTIQEEDLAENFDQKTGLSPQQEIGEPRRSWRQSQNDSRRKLQFRQTLFRSKGTLIVLFCAFALYGAPHFLQHYKMVEMIRNDLSYDQAVSEMGAVREASIDLTILSWKLFSESQIFSESIFTQEPIPALSYLQNSNYKQKVKQAFPSATVQEVLYTSLCDGFEGETAVACSQINSGALNVGMAPFIATISEDFLKAQQYIGDSDSRPLFERELCEKTIALFNFTYSSFGRQVTQNFESVNEAAKQSLRSLGAFQILGIICILVTVVGTACHAIETRRRIRSEILSIDAVQNLYLTEEFKPSLNRLFYQK